MKDVDIRDLKPEELEELRADDREDISALRGLMEHKGWAVFAKLVEHNAAAAETSTGRTALTVLDEALEHNRQVGVVQGLRRSLTLPEALADALASRIEQINQRIEEMDNARNENPETDGGGDGGEPGSEPGTGDSSEFSP